MVVHDTTTSSSLEGSETVVEAVIPDASPTPPTAMPPPLSAPLFPPFSIPAEMMDSNAEEKKEEANEAVQEVREEKEAEAEEEKESPKGVLLSCENLAPEERAGEEETEATKAIEDGGTGGGEEAEAAAAVATTTPSSSLSSATEVLPTPPTHPTHSTLSSSSFSGRSLEAQEETIFLTLRGTRYSDPAIVQALQQVMHPATRAADVGDHEAPRSGAPMQTDTDVPANLHTTKEEEGAPVGMEVVEKKKEKEVPSSSPCGYHCPIFSTQEGFRRHGMRLRPCATASLASSTPTALSIEVHNENDPSDGTVGSRGIRIPLSSGQMVELFNVEETEEFPSIVASWPPHAAAASSAAAVGEEGSAEAGGMASVSNSTTTPATRSSSTAALLPSRMWSANTWGARVLHAIRQQVWKRQEGTQGESRLPSPSPTTTRTPEEATKAYIEATWCRWAAVPRDILGRPLPSAVSLALQQFQGEHRKEKEENQVDTTPSHHDADESHTHPAPAAEEANSHHEEDHNVIPPTPQEDEQSDSTMSTGKAFLTLQMASPLWLTRKHIRALGWRVKASEAAHFIPVLLSSAVPNATQEGRPSPPEEEAVGAAGKGATHAGVETAHRPLPSAMEASPQQQNGEGVPLPPLPSTTNPPHPTTTTTTMPSSSRVKEGTTTTVDDLKRSSCPLSGPPHEVHWFNASQLQPHPAYALDDVYCQGLFLGSSELEKSYTAAAGIYFSSCGTPPHPTPTILASGGEEEEEREKGKSRLPPSDTPTPPSSLSSGLSMSEAERPKDTALALSTNSSSSCRTPVAKPMQCVNSAGFQYSLLNTFLLRAYCQRWGCTTYRTAVFITPEYLRQRGGHVLLPQKTNETMEQKNDTAQTPSTTTQSVTSSTSPTPFTLVAGGDVITLWNVEQTSLCATLRNEAFEKKRSWKAGKTSP